VFEFREHFKPRQTYPCFALSKRQRGRNG